MSGLLAPLGAAGLAALITLGMLIGLLRTGAVTRLLDRPNHRSLHSRATPRIGGIGILGGLALVVLPSWSTLAEPLRLSLVCYAALSVVSLLDDARGLGAATRLLIHLGAALIVVVSFGLSPLAIALAVIGLAWSANLFNFMDGADGLAGGMAVVGFGTMALALTGTPEPDASIMAAATAGAALGFLCLNLPPAKIFMGDSGSVPLGFLAAALGLYGWHCGAWSLAFPLLIFLPFWFDATSTLLIRTARGARPWEAHREHLYQLAVRSGLGHRRVALGAYLLMLGCACTAWLARSWSNQAQWLVLSCAVAAIGGMAAVARRRLGKIDLS